MKRILNRVMDRLRQALSLDFEVDLNWNGISEITPTLYVGPRPLVNDLDTLNARGITHVVSCLPQDRSSEVAFLNEHFETLFLALRDSIHENIASTLPTFFAFAGGAKKLFIHCEVGVSRSATLATALLMQSHAQTFFDAYTQLRVRRPGVLPNIGFASQLQHLEHTLHPETRDNVAHSSLARYLRQVCNVPVEVELLQAQLHQHDYDALQAIRAIFGDDIPRVIQGVRV